MGKVNILARLFISYISFLLLVFLFDLNPRFQIKKNLDWELVFIIVTFPVIGITLLAKRNKFGWAICLFYNLLTALLFLMAFLQPFLKNGNRNFKAIDGWVAYIILLIPFVLVAMLISRDVRDYLKVSTPDLRTTLFISSALSLIIIVTVLVS